MHKATQFFIEMYIKLSDIDQHRREIAWVQDRIEHPIEKSTQFYEEYVFVILTSGWKYELAERNIIFTNTPFKMNKP